MWAGGTQTARVVPLEELARIRATTAGETEDHLERWAAGFAQGYRSAWAAATLHVLDTRGIEYSKHLFRPLYLCGDADLLTRFLGRAVTATHEADLLTGEPNSRSPNGS